MRFDLSRRFHTDSSTADIMKFLESSFRRMSESVYYDNRVLSVESVNATFGSINRQDRTLIEAKQKDNDTLLIAYVSYKPSGWFWIFFICGLFTTIGWLIPIVFYFYQKSVVKDGIEEIFNRTENEFRENKASSKEEKTVLTDDISVQLERLAALKDKGILSEEEFASQKAKILENM